VGSIKFTFFQQDWVLCAPLWSCTE